VLSCILEGSRSAATSNIQAAEKMIYVAQNDPETRLNSREDGDAYTDTFAS
jgi:hypothetical protein